MGKGSKIFLNVFLILASLYVLLRLFGFIAEKYASSITFLLIIGLLMFLTFRFLKHNQLKFVAMCLFLMVFLVELVLTFISPYRSYMERNGSFIYTSPYQNSASFSVFDTPNTFKTESKPEFKYSYKTNNLGLRDSDVNPEQIKFFLVGDSFVQGVGVDDENRIDVLLEEHLQCKECVLNVGAPGSDLFFSFDAMDTLLQNELSPDLVVLNINSSDVTDVITRYLAVARPSLAFEFFYGHSFIFRHIAHSMYGYDFSLLTPSKATHYSHLALQKIADKIYDYKIYLDKKDISFLVLVQPMENELNTESFLLATLERSARKHNIPLVNTREALKSKAEQVALYWPIDFHFNKEGTKAFSEIVFDSLEVYFPQLVNLDATNSDFSDNKRF